MLSALAIRLKLRRTWMLHAMLIPVVVLLIIFCYIPMAGIVISFQDYIPTKGLFGSRWVGLENYKFLFSLNDFVLIIRNTLTISVGKIALGLFVSLVFAVLLVEIRSGVVRKFVQTTVFFPYFLSWVVLGGLFVDMFAREGAVNSLLSLFGVQPIFFLGKPWWFVLVIILTDVWKNFGYNMIIFYAAILGIDASLYESATIDGATWFDEVRHITLPSIAPIMVVLLLLALGGVLNAGFDQIFNMYNPLVYKTSDILDTYIYRIGIVGGQFSFATAVGLFKSLVGMLLLVSANGITSKFAGYRVL